MEQPTLAYAVVFALVKIGMGQRRVVQAAHWQTALFRIFACGINCMCRYGVSSSLGAAQQTFRPRLCAGSMGSIRLGVGLGAITAAYPVSWLSITA